MTTDTGEKGLERLICAALTGAPCDPPQGSSLRVFVADGAAEGAKVYTDEATAYGGMWKMDGCTEPSARGGTLWLPSCSVVCTKGTSLIGLFRRRPRPPRLRWRSAPG